MSYDPILWALLATAFLSSLANVVVTIGGGDPQLKAAMKQATANRTAPVRRDGVTLMLVGLANLGLWTWMAFATHDWRWAALYWLPFTAGWIGRVSR